MEILELMKERHSVRKYTDKPIEKEKRGIIDSFISELNKESGLNIQAIYDEPKCFDAPLAHYGKFSGCFNYVVIVGSKKIKNLEEVAGYYGEKLVLKLQEMGINTCWVVLTKGKTKAVIKRGEKNVVTIALGYGVNNGYPHHNRPLNEVSNLSESSSDMFKLGMEAVMLAPTAIHQQKFYFTEDGDKVYAKCLRGFYSNIDFGIVKYHFEAVTGIKVETIK